MRMRNKVISVVFLIIIFGTGISIKFYDKAADIGKVLLDNVFSYDLRHMQTSAETEERLDVNSPDSISAISSNLLEELPYKVNMVDLNGGFLKKINTRSYYNISNGINITKNGYNVGQYGEISTDYEVQQMQAFKEYLDSKGIQLLYVSEPTKYIDDSFYLDQFGGESYINRNTDIFLERIAELGIDYLDLRDCILKESLDPLSLFYKTDHHWTVPASEWAAGKVAEKLNHDFGYGIDLNLFKPASFNSVSYEDSWLGEQGKKVSKSYIGLDDYIMMEPKYETNYSIVDKAGNLKASGDFGIFINKDIYTDDADYYSAPSWHYSYNPFTGMTIQNENASYGNVLVLGDSYEASMLPFLTLGIKNTDSLILRDFEGSVRDYIEAGNYDTVIIAYAQFMIGAHNDEQNANYRMFTLE